MTTSLPYILLSIVVLLVVAMLVFIIGKNRSQNRLTPMAGLAFGFIIAGVLFGENRLLGYGLMGIGLLVAVIDIYTRGKAK